MCPSVHQVRDIIVYAAYTVLFLSHTYVPRLKSIESTTFKSRVDTYYGGIHHVREHHLQQLYWYRLREQGR